MKRSLIIAACFVCFFLYGQEANGLPSITTEVPESSSIALMTGSMESETALAMDPILLIQQTLNGDWERANTLLEFTDRYDFGVFSRVIDEAIWHELKANQSMLQSKEVLLFYEHVRKSKYLSENWKNYIKREVLNETRRLVVEYLHPNGSSDPKIEANVIEYLQQIDNDVLADVIHAAYDDLMDVIDPLDLVNKLYKTALKSNQLTVAYMKLLQRDRVQSNSTIMSAIYRRLTGLYSGQEVSHLERNLRMGQNIHLYTHLAHSNNMPFYISKCRSEACLSPSKPDNGIIFESSSAPDILVDYKIKFSGDNYIGSRGEITRKSNANWWKITENSNGVTITSPGGGSKLCPRAWSQDIEVRHISYNIPDCVWNVEFIK